jgi:HPt (histidine-containing phosphotransfer) domain-containing protein
VVLAQVEGDEGLFSELAKSFLAESPNLLSAVSMAIQNQDPRSLERAAHSLKSNLGSVSVCPMNQSKREFKKKQAPEKQRHVRDEHDSLHLLSIRSLTP